MNATIMLNTTTTTTAREKDESRIPMLLGFLALAICFRFGFVALFNYLRPTYCPKACPRDIRYGAKRRRGRGVFYGETGSFRRPHHCNNVPADPFQPSPPTQLPIGPPKETKVQEYEAKTQATHHIPESKVQIHLPVTYIPGDLNPNGIV